MKLPERQSLVTQAVQIIQKMILNGTLASPLPGERILASKLQIGRDTLRNALLELERAKWISPRAQGQRRQTLKAPEKLAKSTATKRIGIISPKSLEALPSPMLIEFDALRDTLASRNTLLSILTPPVFESKNPASRLKQYLQDHPADAWILYQCSAPIQQWFADQNLPCIIRGYPHPGINLPYIDEDWEAAAFHAGNQLTNSGHTDIAFLVPDKPLQGLKATESGLRNAFHNASPAHQVHLLKEKGDKDSVIHSLNQGLKNHKNITALVLTRPRHLLNTITWLASHGLKIPEHISIVALCNESWFTEIIPKIHHYKTSHTKMANALARRLTNLIQGHSLDSFATLIIPEQEKGQSIKKMN